MKQFIFLNYHFLDRLNIWLLDSELAHQATSVAVCALRAEHRCSPSLLNALLS